MVGCLVKRPHSCWRLEMLSRDLQMGLYPQLDRVGTCHKHYVVHWGIMSNSHDGADGYSYGSNDRAP